MDTAVRLDLRWQRQAACAGQPETLFFGSINAELTAGLALCQACPVRAECYAFGAASYPRSANWSQVVGGVVLRPGQSKQNSFPSGSSMTM